VTITPSDAAAQAGHRANDVERVRAELTARAAELAVELLGPPNRAIKVAGELRYGNHGSFSVVTRGRKAGVWRDHESGESGDLFALIMRQCGGDFPNAVKYARDFCGMTEVSGAPPYTLYETKDETARIERALGIFNAAGSIDHPIAQRYLERRGLILPASVDHEVLRFHKHCPFGPGQSKPCIVALYRGIHDDEPRAISRTALTDEGVKIDRKMLGPIAGTACKLTPDQDVTLGLHIAEGIETALASMMLGFQPMWALGSAGAISFFPVLAGIECLTIVIDHDLANPETGRTPGQDAAEECSERWSGAGVEVIHVQPDVPGEDMADVIKQQQKEQE